jgi:CRP-like cAMP-binding protein
MYGRDKSRPYIFSKFNIMHENGQKTASEMGTLLRRVNFFSNLDENTITRFSKLAAFQCFQHEETIMLADDSQSAIFFITKGVAKVFSGSKFIKGNLLSLLGVGDFFGETQIFGENERNTISVKAEGPCEVVIFKGSEFFAEISKSTELSMAFLKEECRKVSRAYIQIAALSMNTTKKRVLACIMLFIEEMGVRVPSGDGRSIIKLKNRPSQQQIADMSGTSRESVNRELATLMKEGYLEVDGSDWILLNYPDASSITGK